MAGPSRQLGAAGQFVWGAVGGIAPILVSIIRLSESLPPDAAIPQIGGLGIAAAIASAILGAITSRAFEARNILAALYHGATAPVTSAFVFGINTH